MGVYMRVREYQIIKNLGEGGLGIVSLVKHKNTGKLFAMKQFKENTDQQLTKHEYNVSKYLTKLVVHSPFIAEPVETFCEKGAHYIIMEYLPDSRDLVDYINEYYDQLTQLDQLELLFQIASGVEFFHNHGLVHLDLKPENVIVSHGSVKLIDFGFSCLIEDYAELDAKIACDSHIGRGSLPYVAPEVLSKTVQRTNTYRQSDIYSLGVMFYEILSSDNAFGRFSSQQIYDLKTRSEKEHDQFIHLAFPKWSTLEKSIQDMLTRMIQHQPEQRPSIQEVLEFIIKNKRDC